MNGAPTFSTGDSYGLSVESRQADGTVLSTLYQFVDFDRATGAASGNFVLPDDAAEAVIVFRYQWGPFAGQYDEVRVPVTRSRPTSAAPSCWRSTTRRPPTT